LNDGQENGQLKLVIIIASDSDAEKLTRKLVEQGYPATKVSSTGGFLRKGNATILSGVEANEVEGIVAMVRSEWAARAHRVRPRCRRCCVLRRRLGAPGADRGARRRRHRLRGRCRALREDLIWLLAAGSSSP
jgi:uncharacterized protein YaaQ